MMIKKRENKLINLRELMPTATGDSTGTRAAPQMTGEQIIKWNKQIMELKRNRNLQIFLEHALTNEVNRE